MHEYTFTVLQVHALLGQVTGGSSADAVVANNGAALTATANNKGVIFEIIAILLDEIQISTQQFERSYSAKIRTKSYATIFSMFVYLAVTGVSNITKFSANHLRH